MKIFHLSETKSTIYSNFYTHKNKLTNHNAIRRLGTLQRKPRSLLQSFLQYEHHAGLYMQQFFEAQTPSFHGHYMSLSQKPEGHISINNNSVRWNKPICWVIISKQKCFWVWVFTLRVGSSFPDKAKRRVVFPELGGPKSRVILWGFTIPLTSFRMVTCFFLLESRFIEINISWITKRSRLSEQWEETVRNTS